MSHFQHFTWVFTVSLQYTTKKVLSILLHKVNRATPAVCMLCEEITCRVQDSQLLLPFLLLYTRRIGQIPLLLGQFNQLGEFIVGIIDKCYFVRIKDNANKEMLLGKM